MTNEQESKITYCTCGLQTDEPYLILEMVQDNTKNEWPILSTEANKSS